MRKAALLALVATGTLTAAPPPAAAQSSGQLFCFENDAGSSVFQVRIRSLLATGAAGDPAWVRVGPRRETCQRLGHPPAVRFDVQVLDPAQGGWVPAGACSRTISRPIGGARLRAAGSPATGFTCHVE